MPCFQERFDKEFSMAVNTNSKFIGAFINDRRHIMDFYLYEINCCEIRLIICAFWVKVYEGPIAITNEVFTKCGGLRSKILVELFVEYHFKMMSLLYHLRFIKFNMGIQKEFRPLFLRDCWKKIGDHLLWLDSIIRENDKYFNILLPNILSDIDKVCKMSESKFWTSSLN